MELSLLAAALGLLLWAVDSPLYNWDMIPYVAAAYEADGLSARELSDAVYRDVAAEVGPERFSGLIAGDYRGAVYRDPDSLRQQLPFYRIRLAYIGLLRLSRRAGLSYPQATYVVSAVAVAVSVMLLGATCRSVGVSPLVALVVAALSGYVRLARLSSPDAVATCLTLAVLWLLLERRRAAYALAAILPLVRTDFVLMSLLLAMVAWHRGLRGRALATAGVSVGLYLTVNALSANYGWLTVFNFTLLAPNPYPATMPIADRFPTYVAVYGRGVRSLVLHHHALIYAGGGLLLWTRGRWRTLTIDELTVVAVAAAFVVVHFLLFPVYGERFFAFAASSVLIGSLAAWQRSRRGGASLAVPVTSS